MQTRHLHEQAEAIMATYAGRDLKGEERRAMDRLVHRFFTERVSDLDESEMMARMATPMKALAWFTPYLCQSFWQHCCSGPLPEGADTCRPV